MRSLTFIIHKILNTVEYLLTFDFVIPSNAAINHLLNIKLTFAAYLEKSEGMALPTFGQGMSAFPGFALCLPYK